MQLVLDTTGLHLLVKSSVFYLRTEKLEKMISPSRVSSILISAKCIIHSSAFILAAENDIPVYFLGRFGKTTGIFRKDGFNNAAEIRRRQILFGEDSKGVIWVKALFVHKLHEQISLLSYLKNRKQRFKGDIVSTERGLEETIGKIRGLKGSLSEIRSSILGLEGSSAKKYWDCISLCLPAEFMFENRTRNPATDPFNASINYLYGMLYTQVESAIYAVGLDPALGVFHADQYQKPVLSYDLIEPFRAWADKFAIVFFNQHGYSSSWFSTRKEGVILSKSLKKEMIPAFHLFLNEEVRFNRSQVSRKNHIFRFAGELVKLLLEK
ncbi:CRISPR-associated endonuclease Cas1 [Marinilongibacter aquaticus]|uniref:CRISPR-associated endonuclease Cas1 n=1 Tax=Marinilongibacter aquaticus TaxID=2975157 RepID=UPI0021BDB712|nr:CRISPR-associated endonuclease Cas1 [Marinilongibacter aquaticus]UBM60769.1 CRISPR-associated endonuclease Cas1 [Marinilongibacter aquaticus]